MNYLLVLQSYETYDGGTSGVFYMGFDDAWLLVLLRGHGSLPSKLAWSANFSMIS